MSHPAAAWSALLVEGCHGASAPGGPFSFINVGTVFTALCVVFPSFYSFALPRGAVQLPWVGPLTTGSALSTCRVEHIAEQGGWSQAPGVDRHSRNQQSSQGMSKQAFGIEVVGDVLNIAHIRTCASLAAKRPRRPLAAKVHGVEGDDGCRYEDLADTAGAPGPRAPCFPPHAHARTCLCACVSLSMYICVRHFSRCELAISLNHE